MIVKLPINKIIIPQGLLPRIFGVNEEKVEEYAEAMENGAEFPPIKVWEKLDGTYQVIDGVHRISAYRKLGKEYIEAEIIQGIEDEVNFMEWAIRENLKHGLPLSREDKREDARRLYIKGRKPESIARLFRVHIATVYKWIKDIKDEKQERLRQKAIQLRNQGLTSREISEKLGVPDRTIREWLAKIHQDENLPTDSEDESAEEKTEEYDGSWDDWNEEEETEEPVAEEKPKPKKEPKKLLHPNQILERCKTEIWDAVIEIEFRLGEDKALEVLEEIYFAYKERKHKGLTIYKDIRARYDAYEK
ncbi:helix-turn-helix domain-containing protein [Persephonella sp.]